MLATLARQGRAFGMNLFLCTQRPDAGILAGQIKNNLLGRLCGNTPDPELRRMILGDTPAAERSPRMPRAALSPKTALPSRLTILIRHSLFIQRKEARDKCNTTPLTNCLYYSR